MESDSQFKENISRIKQGLEPQRDRSRRLKKSLKSSDQQRCQGATLIHSFQESQNNQSIYLKTRNLDNTAAPVAPVAPVADPEAAAEREAIRIADGLHPTRDDVAPAVELVGSRRRETVNAYRRYDPKATPAMISPDGGDGWVLMEYDDGTHACFNKSWGFAL